MITKSTEIKQCHTTPHLRQIMSDQSAPPQSRTMASALIGTPPEFRDGVEHRADQLLAKRSMVTAIVVAEVLIEVFGELAEQEGAEIIVFVSEAGPKSQ